jgi:AcrR family transcriptional regulator
MGINSKNVQIIKSAQTVFAEYGYTKVTLDDVAQRLGMTRTALYYYYKNKEEIFTAVLYYEIEQYAEELAVLLSNSGSALDNLLEFCKRYGNLKNRFSNMYKLSTQVIHTSVEISVFCGIRTRISELHRKIIETILQNDSELPRGIKFSEAANLLTLSIRGIAIDSHDKKDCDIVSDIQKLCKIFYFGLIHTPLNKSKKTL